MALVFLVEASGVEPLSEDDAT